MDQDKLRGLGKDEVKNELVKQFTKHIEEEELDGQDESVVKVKLVVVGPSGSGKTSWVTQLLQNKFNQGQNPTIGAKFSSQGVAIEDFVYNFEIWDVSGDEWYKSLVPMYLQYAQAVVVTYDITSETSFEEAKTWIKYVKSTGERDLSICLVGMKSDLAEFAANPVPQTAAKEFFVEEMRLEKQFFFPQVSAKTGENVSDVILTLAEAFHDRGLMKSPRNSVLDTGEAYKFANVAAENEKTLLRNGRIDQSSSFYNQEKVEEMKERMSACGAWLSTWFGVCFQSSKEIGKKTLDSTKKNVREVSATMNRKSRKIGKDFKLRTAELIRKSRKLSSPENYNNNNNNQESVVEYEENSPEYTKRIMMAGNPKIQKLKG